jgi:AcrR family transcriptional regulator
MPPAPGRETSAGKAMRGRAREALLAAAMRCIRERGYVHTTQGDVLAKSGANPRSITYHFGSKERLMASALAETFRQRSEPLLEAGERAPGSAMQRFTEVFVALLDEVRADRELAFALVDAVAQARSEELRDVFGDHYRQVRSRIAILIRAVLGDRYEATGGDIDALAAALLALVDGLVLQWLVDPESLPEGERLVRSLSSAFTIAGEQGRPVSS